MKTSRFIKCSIHRPKHYGWQYHIVPPCQYRAFSAQSGLPKPAAVRADLPEGVFTNLLIPHEVHWQTVNRTQKPTWCSLTAAKVPASRFASAGWKESKTFRSEWSNDAFIVLEIADLD